MGIATDYQVHTGTYWLTRIVFLRYLAFIYFVAFLVAYHQNEGLIGTNGLLPYNKYLQSISSSSEFKNLTEFERFQKVPTIFWWLQPWNNDNLRYVEIAGLALSGFVFLCGWANKFMMFGLWILYHSLNAVGQRWYGFGWESMLLEIGFAAIFLVPLVMPGRLPSGSPTPLSTVWAYRWLMFRLMLGAGLIKIRGDQCWRDLSCMDYHYETQPVPNPLSPYYHGSSHGFHMFETMVNHLVELPLPFILFGSRKVRILGGIAQIVFQMILISSGNLSFLNWLSIAPCILVFDDASLSFLFSEDTLRYVAEIQLDQFAIHDISSKEMKISHSWRLKQRSFLGHIRYFLQTVTSLCFVALIVHHSRPVVHNLVLSNQQAMNAAFDPFMIVNTYGAFGSITKTRTEIILEGTHAENALDPKAQWFEYEFKCKPSGVDRKPCLISPYHYRLDWLMWFAAFQNYNQNPWLIHLTAKLLSGDPIAFELMGPQRNNPIDSPPPRFVRASHYKYWYTSPWEDTSAHVTSTTSSSNGTDSDVTWWKRERIGEYFPPIELANPSVQEFMKHHGWEVKSPVA